MMLSLSPPIPQDLKNNYFSPVIAKKLAHYWGIFSEEVQISIICIIHDTKKYINVVNYLLG